jgi:hypothetical protein
LGYLKSLDRHGRVPAIHVLTRGEKDVDGRDKRAAMTAE